MGDCLHAGRRVEPNFDTGDPCRVAACYVLLKIAASTNALSDRAVLTVVDEHAELPAQQS